MLSAEELERSFPLKALGITPKVKARLDRAIHKCRQYPNLAGWLGQPLSVKKGLSEFSLNEDALISARFGIFTQSGRFLKGGDSQLPADFGVMPIIRSTIRYGAAALLAGFVLCGPAGHHPFQIEELGSFSAAAAANSHAQGSNPWSATSIPTVAQHHRRRWGQHPQKDQNRLGIGPEGHQVAVSFDAEKRAVQVHVPLNGKGDFETHPSYRTGWSFLQPLHSERENRQLFGRAHFKSVERAISERSTPSELLNKEVLPTESRFKHALAIAPEDGTSVMAKTKLGIAGLSFAPFEILGVNLDPKSLERAEALGFKVDKESGTPAGGLPRVIRLLTPPNTDAISAQEILSKELPGHRFELNKVYRLYRASMSPGAGPQKPAGEPYSPHVCPPERCYSRPLIQWEEHLGECAKGLRIGVIDTEIDIGHPAFKGRHIHRDSFVPDGKPAAPDWHGTGVLAILAGNPTGGTPGLVPDAEFFVATVFYTEEDGAMAADTASLHRALGWMKDNHVRLVNMSFSGPPDDLVREAIETLSSSGTVLVAAAGNEGPVAEPAFPAAYPQVIAVTAVTKDLRNYRYANRGPHIDVAAPGVDILSAAPSGRESYHTGTSFAAPHVTGTLAVMPRELLTGNKDNLLGSMQVLDLGAPGRDPVYGRGLLLAPAFCPGPVEEIVDAQTSVERAQ